jgi:thioredoxin-like negative regulator of GroEL
VPPPAPGKEPDPAIAAAQAALSLAEQAQSVGDLAPLEQKLAADPNDHQARFDLAVALSAKGDRRRRLTLPRNHSARPRRLERSGGARACSPS